ncbi:MAG: DUF4864 domain-containing protein [Candidatus Manganitrophus sp.]|nr:DUF4864 domain-containing protein [Candidatus Manganitrophus sp.]WDT70229.1 MAG: DUF4864 domain-containing protein [Candidatus Manganitrophus sp.]WDT78118.1 MAG: DUF4864 domain-containing protein [Candidatus Manganitrophus sp.]
MIIAASFMFLYSILFPAHTVAAPHPTDLIQSVIRQQMNAFNKDDYATARTFASAGLRQRFSKERFEMMVKSGYPQIAKSHLVSFEEILFSDDNQAAVATVHITGKDRVTVIARYLMVLEGDAWKINGVMILEEIQPIRLSREVKFPLPPSSFINHSDSIRFEKVPIRSTPAAILLWKSSWTARNGRTGDENPADPGREEMSYE